MAIIFKNPPIHATWRNLTNIIQSGNKNRHKEYTMYDSIYVNVKNMLTEIRRQSTTGTER